MDMGKGVGGPIYALLTKTAPLQWDERTWVTIIHWVHHHPHLPWLRLSIHIHIEYGYRLLCYVKYNFNTPSGMKVAPTYIFTVIPE